jgi:hypothetical protein
MVMPITYVHHFTEQSDILDQWFSTRETARSPAVETHCLSSFLELFTGGGMSHTLPWAWNQLAVSWIPTPVDCCYVGCSHKPDIAIYVAMWDVPTSLIQLYTSSVMLFEKTEWKQAHIKPAL